MGPRQERKEENLNCLKGSLPYVRERLKQLSMSGKIPHKRLKLKIEVSDEEITDAAILRKKPLIPSRPTALFEGSRERLEKTESSVIGRMGKKGVIELGVWNVQNWLNHSNSDSPVDRQAEPRK